MWPTTVDLSGEHMCFICLLRNVEKCQNYFAHPVDHPYPLKPSKAPTPSCPHILLPTHCFTSTVRSSRSCRPYYPKTRIAHTPKHPRWQNDTRRHKTGLNPYASCHTQLSPMFHQLSPTHLRIEFAPNSNGLHQVIRFHLSQIFM